MKKLSVQMPNGNLQEVATKIREDFSEDDIPMIGNATKANNLAILLQAATINKAAVTAAQESVAAAENTERTKKEELNNLVESSLESNAAYIAKKAEVTAAVANLDAAVNGLNALLVEKKSLSAAQKLYLKDNDFLDLIENEEQLGLDLTGVGGQKAVLLLKSKGTEYLPNESKSVADFYDFILDKISESLRQTGLSESVAIDTASKTMKKYFSVNFDALALDFPDIITSLVQNEFLTANEVKEAKVNTTTSSINNFNWLSSNIEDN